VKTEVNNTQYYINTLNSTQLNSTQPLLINSTMATAPVTTTPPKQVQSKSQGRGRSNSLPGHVVDYLKNWLMSPEHINHPYPSESEKARMVADTGIEIKRLNNWFVNNRIRFWKPRFEAMKKQKQRDQKKRKLSNKSNKKDSISSSETSSMPPTKGASRGTTRVTPRGTPIVTPIVTPRVTPSSLVGVGQVATKNIQAVVPAPWLDLSQLVRTAIFNTDVLLATVSDDDSCSCSSNSTNGSSNCGSQASGNCFDMKKKTSMLFRQCRKRQRTENENDRFDTTTTTTTSDLESSSPRFKYMCNDVEQWKLACSTCPKLEDTNLPSLDEAVHLFGYSFNSIVTTSN